MTNLIIVPCLTFAASIALHAASLKIFPRLNLLDFPQRYGLKRARLPYPTGIVSIAIFLLVFTTYFPHTIKEIGIVAAVILLGVISFIDDRNPIPFWQRGIVQLALCLLLFATGSRIYTITHPLGGFIKLDEWVIFAGSLGSLPVWSGVFTVLWLGLTMNALNWFDGIPGQVSVLSAIGFLLLGGLALLRTDQPETALLCFVLAGIAFGSAVFDFPPARVIIGDSGSMFFGLMLGLIAVMNGGKVATAFIVLAIPLFDAIFVIIRRIASGKSPFKGNRDHLHHRLLERGWSEQSIVLLTAAFSATFGITALFLDTNGKAVAIIIALILMIMITRYAQPNVNDG